MRFIVGYLRKSRCSYEENPILKIAGSVMKKESFIIVKGRGKQQENDADVLREGINKKKHLKANSKLPFKIVEESARGKNDLSRPEVRLAHADRVYLHSCSAVAACRDGKFPKV